jgi:hypothetical protein
MIKFDSYYPLKNQKDVGVNENIRATVSADYRLDPRDIVFKIHGVEVVPEVYTVYYGETTSQLVITLYTKRRIKYKTKRTYGQEDFRYGQKDMYPSMLQYGHRYVVQITAFGINREGVREEVTETFSFTTEEGVYENQDPPEYFYSQMTQGIANYFPDWSKTRFDQFSIAQQLMNPIGEGLEKTLDFISKQRKNNFIQTCNLQELSSVFQVELGKDYPIISSVAQSGETFYVQPEIKAVRDITQYELFADQSNTIESFYYNRLPTRINASRKTIRNPSIIIDEPVTTLGISLDHEMEDISRVYVSFKWVDSSSYVENEKIIYKKLKIYGKDYNGEDVEEVLFLKEEHLLLTETEWSYIYKIETVNTKDDQVLVSLYQLPPAETLQKDLKRILTTDDRFESVYWNMRSVSGRSVLERRIAEGHDFVSLERTSHKTKVETEFEMLDIDNKTNLNLVDMAVDPFSNNIYGIDNNYLYIFDKREGYTKRAKEIHGDNGLANFVMDIECDRTVRDEDNKKLIGIRCIQRLPEGIIVRYRIKVSTPSGNVLYLRNDGELVTDKDSGIITVKQHEMMYESKRYEIALSEVGDYLLDLETLYRGGKTSSYKQIIRVRSLSALKKFKLERILDGIPPISIKFYPDQTLKVYDASERLNTLTLHKDGVMINYEDKVLYFTENYDYVEVS